MRTSQVCWLFRWWRAFALWALASGAGLIAAPDGRAQQIARAASQLPLARYFPGQDLVVYVEFDGVDRHNAAWKKTAVSRLFCQTTTGAMYAAALPRIFEIILSNQTDVSINGKELTGLGLHLFRSGFAVGINRAGGTGAPRCFALVVRGGAKGQIQKLVDRVLRGGASPRAGVRDIKKSGGRTIHEFGAPSSGTVGWWSEGDDLVVSLVAAHGPDVIIDALEGRVPNAVAHPNRLALLQSEDVPGFEPVGLAYFDMAALPPLPQEAVSLGLDRIKRFDYRWGFQNDALLSIVGAVVPAPRTGIPAMFDQPTFDTHHLPPLPGGLAGFTVVSLDEPRLAPRLRESVRALLKPPLSADPDRIEESLRAFFGVSPHDEIFAHLGTRFTLYDVATRINAPSHILESLAQGLFRAPKMALVAEVKNRDLLAKSIHKLIAHANVALRALPGQPNALSLGEIQRLKNGETGYMMSFAGSEIPIASGLRPTLLLGQKTLVLASTPAVARRARDLAESQSQPGLPPGDPLGAKLDWLPGKLTMLSVADTAASVYPELIVGMPGFAESIATAMASSGGSPFEGPGAVVGMPGGRAGSSPTPPFDAELVPDPDELRPFLFPSVHALVVDQAGIRFLSREAIPTLNPSTAVPIALAALVPAIHTAQLSRGRAQSTNNLKQLGLAFHNFHSANDHFPADIRGKDGKPLLSWRVAILPFLEQGAIFNEFRLDEPWDSPHNKPLIARMPAVFSVPDGSPADPGLTFYRGFAGKDTIFDPRVAKGVAINQITDGTSNTIAIVEAKEAVPWTKPASDLPFDEDPKAERIKANFDALGGHFEGGFNETPH